MQRSRTLLALLTIATLTSACGGSGGDGTSILILSDGAQDGYVLSNGTVQTNGAGPAIGDIDAILPGVGGRMFFTFSLAAIPAGATVTNVSLEITQQAVLGTPYPTHGGAIFDHLDYGPALDAGDFNLVAFASAIGVVLTDPALITNSINVTSHVRADIAAGRTDSQFRLRFSNFDSDNDGVNDAVLVVDGERSGGTPAGTEPKLIVTYQ